MGKMRVLVPMLMLLGSMGAARAEGEDLRVYLMTIGPGALAYERFGHNQIWVHDARDGTDIGYNYGVFEWDQENFLWRFIQGRMLYRIEAVSAEMYRKAYESEGWKLSPDKWLALPYIADDRSVWVQELDLTAQQKASLQAFLNWNLRSENAQYRYDYYRDNCSTRVRDALDRPDVLDGALAAGTKGAMTDRTYRWHTRRLSAVDPLLYTAIYKVLGQPADQPISQWEETFLPMKLMEAVRQVKVRDEAGNERPLVRREYRLSISKSIIEPAAPPRWAWAIYLAVGVGVGGVMVGLSVIRHWSVRWMTATLVVVWSLVAGVAGVIATWAWFTDHTAAHWNENWLQLNPLSLGVMVLVARVAISRERRQGRAARGVAGAVLAMALVGTVLQVLPGFDQVNGEMIVLALPLHLAVAAVTWRRTTSLFDDGEPGPAGRR